MLPDFGQLEDERLRLERDAEDFEAESARKCPTALWPDGTHVGGGGGVRSDRPEVVRLVSFDTPRWDCS